MSQPSNVSTSATSSATAASGSMQSVASSPSHSSGVNCRLDNFEDYKEVLCRVDDVEAFLTEVSASMSVFHPIWLLYLCLVYLQHKITLLPTMTFPHLLYFGTILLPIQLHSLIKNLRIPWLDVEWGHSIYQMEFPPMHGICSAPVQPSALGAVWSSLWTGFVLTHQVVVAPNLGLTFQWLLHIVCSMQVSWSAHI